jgi:antirestriction protein ArdC
MGETNDGIKANVFQIVTDRIVARLDAGDIPWRKPWTGEGVPMNLHSKKEYRGINLWLLHNDKYKSPWWLSFKQVGVHGGRVKKGEAGTIVTFWKVGKYKERQADGTDKERKSFLLRYYRVWNSEQCTGIEIPKTEVRVHQPIDEAEAMVKAYKGCPVIEHGGNQACYFPSLDRINMPKPETFKGGEHYYQTLFHECVHSTGHKSRLKRLDDKAGVNWHDSYSKEELVAEMGATFLGQMCGINNDSVMENATAYIQHWRNAISKDNRLIVSASGKAQKAVDWITGKDWKDATEDNDESN